MGKVLVVEDDHLICNLIREALQDDGHEVHCARSDRQAYDLITAPPSLDGLVLDVNLGAGTTGYEVARFARQFLPDVAVIYISGEVSPASFKAVGVPNSTFLPKPFTPKEIVEAVAMRLAQAEA